MKHVVKVEEVRATVGEANILRSAGVSVEGMGALHKGGDVVNGEPVSKNVGTCKHEVVGVAELAEIRGDDVGRGLLSGLLVLMHSGALHFRETHLQQHCHKAIILLNWEEEDAAFGGSAAHGVVRLGREGMH